MSLQPASTSQTATTSQDACYISLLGLAEYFRTSQPPNIKRCIQCLQALFTFNPPSKVEARTHLQMGQILMTYTHNIDKAREHLEKAWKLSESLLNFDDVKFDTASMLAELYKQIDQVPLAKAMLRKAIELSQNNVYWHCKLLLQLSQLHANDKEYTLASELLAVGAESADESSATYLKVLFLLSRAMILMIERKTNDVLALLNSAGAIIDNSIANPHQKEYLKVFFLVLQVCYYLALGQVKTVKPSLKQLQMSIQTIMAPNWPADEVIFGQNPLDMFVWLPKEQLYVLVYLVTVSHSMMAGYMDKAQKYTEKALTQIEKLKSQDDKPILSVFKVILLEHIVMCRLVMGNRELAIREIAICRDVCMSSGPKGQLMRRHSAQLHCLVGLYAMSTSFFEHAERQFLTCVTETSERDLKLFANLNLAIIYLRTKRDKDLKQILDAVSTENTHTYSSQALMGGFYYVQGLHAFHKASFHEAKRFLRETLKMANAEDLNRLTSCSLVLLSHVFLSIGNSKESMNMVTPAMQLASKIPDIHVQLWGSAILKDLHRMSKDAIHEKEAYANHVKYSENLIADQLRCVQSPHHALIDWLDGPPNTMLAITAPEKDQQMPTNALPLPPADAKTTMPVQQPPMNIQKQQQAPAQNMQLPIASTSTAIQYAATPSVPQPASAPPLHQPHMQSVIVPSIAAAHPIPSTSNQIPQNFHNIQQAVGPQVHQLQPQQYGQYY
ncbi:MAU2 chromatid cohesion factor homolog [Musca domestica]|uniref:MAU2 chromatid cohesion factor homolog n=1 Tax=Musca domestica TaxID=7370 RepID=A0A1I8N939_MUSDO|nr:MAU2 chromatid cohesion factor homolog [Musca domestica]